MDAYAKILDDIYELAFRMDKLYADYAKRSGESYNSMMVLHILQESPEGVSQKEICEALFLPKQPVRSIVESLEEREFISVRVSETDKRSKLLVLTMKGRYHSETVLNDLRKIELSCLRQMDENDLVRMNEANRVYLQLFEEAMKKG